MELASCRPSGAQNFDVAARFLENLCTPSLFLYAYNHIRPPRAILNQSTKVSNLCKWIGNFVSISWSAFRRRFKRISFVFGRGVVFWDEFAPSKYSQIITKNGYNDEAPHFAVFTSLPLLSPIKHPQSVVFTAGQNFLPTPSNRWNCSFVNVVITFSPRWDGKAFFYA
jgi:hypothetical protein